MLDGIRKATANWLGKLVMAVVVGFLIISFGIWGIGDIFRIYGRTTVAKVGSTEIGVEQFRQLYNDRLRLLGQQFKRPITPDMARALGIDRRLLGEVISEAALDERARQLKLNLPDDEIARQITIDPNFRGPTGQFDRFLFDAKIRNAGFSEPRYASEQRKVALRREIALTISGQVAAPKTAANAMDRYQNEERWIEYVLLEASAAGEIPAPAPEVIAKYFEERKARFRAPEFRKLVLLPISADELARSVEVSDADTRRVYDEHPDRFGTPERRQIKQIVFPKAEDARAASERIAAGGAFAAVAAEFGVKEQDIIDLGLVTKAAVFDRAIADAAFALAEGATSAPITGRFGTSLVYLAKIEPGHTTSFEEVAPQIKKEIALDRAKPKVLDTHDKIEDERASGMRIEEVAKKLGLTSRTIEAVDRSGRGPDGQPIADLPAGADIVSAAFSTDVNVEADPVQLPGGGFMWYDVVAITPAHERRLDEVKDKVEAQWHEEEVVRRLTAKAAEMVDKLKSEASFPDVAASAGVTVQPMWGLKRGRASGAVSAQAADAVFRTAKGASGSAEGSDPTQRIVFRVTDIKEPTFDAASPDGQRLVETLRRSLSDDLYGQYIASLQADLGTSINEEQLRRAVGGGESN
jgi:peptidyl-prolyl cis-trans isomerase D